MIDWTKNVSIAVAWGTGWAGAIYADANHYWMAPIAAATYFIGATGYDYAKIVWARKAAK